MLKYYEKRKSKKKKPSIFRPKEYRYDLLLRRTRVGLAEISQRRMGSGNYFRNLVTVGLQITVANCVYNYNLRANQLRVTTARGVRTAATRVCRRSSKNPESHF